MATYTIAELDPIQWVDRIDHVFKSAYAIEAELLGVRSFPPLDREKKDILSCGNSFFGFISGSDLCGVVELETHQCASTETTIASLAVTPSHFRRGIGGALVRSVLEGEVKIFRVTTGKLNQPAIELYIAQGFELIGNFATPDGIEMVELVFNPT